MGHYNLLGYRFATQFESRLGERLLDRLYAPYRDVTDCAPSDRFALSHTADGGGWQVQVNGERVSAATDLGEALRLLEYAICRRAIDDRTEYIVLHGALVCRDGASALIIGPSGAGKTTLALALRARGFTVLCDDIVFLDPRCNRLLPLPRCFHLERGTDELLRRVGAPLAGAGLELGFVTPADLGTFTGYDHMLRAVIALAEATPHASCRPVTQAEVAVRLLDEAGWSRAHGPAPLAALAALLAPTRCLSLSRRTLTKMVDAIATLPSD